MEPTDETTGMAGVLSNPIEQPQTILERLLLPGWWFHSSNNYQTTIRGIHKQLLARPKPLPGVWGDDPKRLQTARYLCGVLKEEYDWPNNHFIPDDPFDIIFQIPWDDLQIVEVVMRFEEDLKIKIEDKEAEKFTGTLGDIVAFLVDKQEQSDCGSFHCPA